MTMSVREAKEILNCFDSSKRMVDPDGRMAMATRVWGRAEAIKKIMNGQEAAESVFLSEREKRILAKAALSWSQRFPMSLDEAADRAEKMTTPSGKVVPADGRDKEALQIMFRSAAIESVLDGYKGPVQHLSEREVKTIRKIAAETARITDQIAKRAQPKKTSLWKRLGQQLKRIIPKDKFDWKKSVLWYDTPFQTKDQVIFSYRMNLSNLTPDQKKQVRADLTKMGIRFTERKATRRGCGAEVGDWTLRLADEASIRRFRETVLKNCLRYFPNPIAMSHEEYKRQQEHTATGGRSGRSEPVRAETTRVNSVKNEGQTPPASHHPRNGGR